MIRKIVIANIISAGILTAIGVAALPVSVKVSTWVVNKMLETNK